MITTISFWHKDEQVMSIYHDEKYGITVLPFSKGDKIYLHFDELYPKDIEDLKRKGYKDHFINHILNDYKDKHEKYRYGEWEIVKVSKSLSKHFEGDTTLNVEYHIKKVRKIYWKFWRLYKWKQFWKNLFKTFN